MTLQTSPEVNEISAALALAYGEFKPIIKDKWNSHFESHYADLASVREAVVPALAKHGIFPIQVPNAVGQIVSVTTRLAHRSGQWIQGVFSAEAKNASAQQVGAASTFICRYSLVHMLGLSLGEDDDGNSTNKNVDQDGPLGGGGKNLIEDPDAVFDFDSSEAQKSLAAELRRRNVPDFKWEAIGKWLHGKNKNQLSKAIASV